MKISTLGPKGTFSHQASLKYSPEAEILFEHTVKEVFESVEKQIVDIGIIPLENSVSGTVGFTVNALTESNLNIVAEIILPVNHCLVGKDLNNIKTIYAHAQTHAQCDKFIQENFPKAKIIHTSSNGNSAELIASETGQTIAAIVPGVAAELYHLNILKKDIQDNKYNVTKFIVISKGTTTPTGRDRTTISVFAQSDKPGLLYGLLGEFAKRNINLSKIESVPSNGKLGNYFFFIDFEGHKEDIKVKEAFKAIESDFFLKIHGSYSREY